MANMKRARKALEAEPYVTRWTTDSAGNPVRHVYFRGYTHDNAADSNTLDREYVGKLVCPGTVRVLGMHFCFGPTHAYLVGRGNPNNLTAQGPRGQRYAQILTPILGRVHDENTPV
ncbi:MAG: hypothetical protein QT00_C0002G0292 [archaeon GW2011_AR5]|nr:MAG: hypothetical protein QT00_C0002G0292 [archaeon GW2011_AR5]